MLFTILISLLILICISVSVFFFYSFTNHNSKTGFSESENVFLLPKETMKESRKIAVVKCSSIREPQERLLQHSKQIDCSIYLNQYGKVDFCKYGCIGYGSCATICPENAIIIKNNTAIVTDSCSGCGLCVDKCPQKIIELIDVKNGCFTQCSLPKSENNSNCSASCISCKKCDSEDFKLEYCPHMCIKKTPIITNKGFKFWQFCYNMFHRSGK